MIEHPLAESIKLFSKLSEDVVIALIVREIIRQMDRIPSAVRARVERRRTSASRIRLAQKAAKLLIDAGFTSAELREVGPVYPILAITADAMDALVAQ